MYSGAYEWIDYRAEREKRRRRDERWRDGEMGMKTLQELQLLRVL
jgi:hypothetical protein